MVDDGRWLILLQANSFSHPFCFPSWVTQFSRPRLMPWKLPRKWRALARTFFILLHFFMCVRCFACMCSFVSVVHWVVCILVCNSGVHFCFHFCLVLLMYCYVHVYYVLLFFRDQNCIWQLQEPVFTQTLLSLFVSFFVVLCFFFFPIKVCEELVNKMSSPSNPCHFCSSVHLIFMFVSFVFRSCSVCV